MLRIALDFLRPGMILGRDIYGINGKSILVAGIELTDKHIEYLRKWDIISIYVKNPIIDLPAIDNVVQEKTRIKALQAAQSALDKTIKTGYFTETPAIKDVVLSIIQQILEKKQTLIHLSQIHRHHDDLLSHSVNVAILATLTACALGINDRSQLNTITLGAMFHDLGMIMVPKNILIKTEPLSKEEQEIYKSHAKIGFEILRQNREIPLLVSHIAFQHHERFDGKGYPRKLADQEINKLAHIVAIADEYDNLVADRPGQKGMETHVAYEAIVAGVNTKFEPTIAKAFLSRIAIYPVGTMVRITTGEIGVVIKVTPLLQHRPELQIITDAQGQFLSQPYTVDLTTKEGLTVFIESVLSDEYALALFINLKNKKDYT